MTQQELEKQAVEKIGELLRAQKHPRASATWSKQSESIRNLWRMKNGEM
jgi:hypothetical protein